MIDAVLSSPLFGLALTAAAWQAGLALQRRTRLAVCNPLLVASLLIIALLSTDEGHEDDNTIPTTEHEEGGEAK